MDIALITGSAGLVGAACARLFAAQGLKIVGIDNDMRRYFFGDTAGTSWMQRELETALSGYCHYRIDIRDTEKLEPVFREYNDDIKIVIHAAAQPSHDWAAKEPITDFSINATGTLNILEMTRNFCPDAVFIHCSTNKVYGDTPNRLPLVELESRWEVAESHPFHTHGIDESMNIDQSCHSLFGASKVAADVLVQEYGRYFGLKTGVFRGGCLTGPGHSGAEMHGFLAYLMKCAMLGDHYIIYGYKGKQVRDNIHCEDLANCFYQFYQSPRTAEVYNMGGSRYSNCSMLEAIKICERIVGKKMKYSYSENNRTGDHVWYISDVRKFKGPYPDWNYRYDIEEILVQIYEELIRRSAATSKRAV